MLALLMGGDMYKLIFSKETLIKDKNHIFDFSHAIVPEVLNEKKMVILTGGKFLFLTENGKVIEESTYLWGHLLLEKISKTKRIKHLEGEWIIAGNALSETEFYHFFYQVYSGLLLLKRHGFNLSKYNILVSKRAPWAKAYLEKIGINNATEIEEDTLYIVESAFFTNTMWGSFHHNPDKELLEEYSRIDIASNVGFPKIYISRNDSKKRRVANEIELVSFLESRGYKKIVLSEFSIDDQISIFRSANEIVAPHGAGLTNLVFSKSGSRVIELFPENHINKCFWAIAKRKSMKYEGLVNPVDHNSAMKERGPHFYSQVVDLDLLNSFV